MVSILSGETTPRRIPYHSALRHHPATEEQFADLLEQTYQQLTGAPLTRRDPIFVERHSHGGMSSGYISPQFWAETAIPLLRARYRDTP
jgi:hypothetical protein